MELLFTGVAFGLIGMSVRDALDTAGTHIWQAVQVGVVLSVVAFAVRFVWMWVLYKLNEKKHRTNVSPLRLQEVLLMAWAGMRGLVTPALVLAILSAGDELPSGTVGHRADCAHLHDGGAGVVAPLARGRA